MFIIRYRKMGVGGVNKLINPAVIQIFSMSFLDTVNPPGKQPQPGPNPALGGNIFYYI